MEKMQCPGTYENQVTVRRNGWNAFFNSTGFTHDQQYNRLATQCRLPRQLELTDSELFGLQRYIDTLIFYLRKKWENTIDKELQVIWKMN